MAHQDLTASSSVSLAGLGAIRTFQVLGGGNDTKITFYSADTTSAASGVPIYDGRKPARRQQLILRANEQAVFEETSTYVGYTLTGAAPTAVYVDAPGAQTSAAVATTGAAGTALLSVAPTSAAAPVVVASNDPRVLTAECPLPLGADCSLGEQTIWAAPVPCTVTAIYIETGSKAIAASNSNYVTLTAKQRPALAPGTPATMVTTTTKAADLNATAAWTDKSLGSLSNTTFLAGDKVTLTGATTGTITGGVPGFARIAYTVP